MAPCKGRRPWVDNSFRILGRVASKGLGCNSGDHVDPLLDRASIHRCSVLVLIRVFDRVEGKEERPQRDCRSGQGRAEQHECEYRIVRALIPSITHTV